MIVTRGMGRGAVVGAIVVGGLGVHVLTASIEDMVTRRIGEPVVDVVELRVGSTPLDIDPARLGAEYVVLGAEYEAVPVLPARIGVPSTSPATEETVVANEQPKRVGVEVAPRPGKRIGRTTV